MACYDGRNSRQEITDADFARYYCLSILDKHHHPDCSLEEGLALLTLCTDELKRRLPFDYKGVSSFKRHEQIRYSDTIIYRC